MNEVETMSRLDLLAEAHDAYKEMRRKNRKLPAWKHIDWLFLDANRRGTDAGEPASVVLLGDDIEVMVYPGGRAVVERDSEGVYR